MVLEFMKGYKTKTGLILYGILAIVGSLGILPESVIVNIVQTLSVMLAGYGLYDKDKK